MVIVIMIRIPDYFVCTGLHILLYCTVLYCSVLCCTALYCYCSVLYCFVLYCIVLYCTVLRWGWLVYCIGLYLHCIARWLYCIVFYCTVLCSGWLARCNIGKRRVPSNSLDYQVFEFREVVKYSENHEGMRSSFCGHFCVESGFPDWG